jgi:hypothetical protein
MAFFFQLCCVDRRYAQALAPGLQTAQMLGPVTELSILYRNGFKNTVTVEQSTI